MKGGAVLRASPSASVDVNSGTYGTGTFSWCATCSVCVKNVVKYILEGEEGVSFTPSKLIITYTGSYIKWFRTSGSFTTRGSREPSRWFSLRNSYRKWNEFIFVLWNVGKYILRMYFYIKWCYELKIYLYSKYFTVLEISYKVANALSILFKDYFYFLFRRAA